MTRSQNEAMALGALAEQSVVLLQRVAAYRLYADRPSSATYPTGFLRWQDVVSWTDEPTDGNWWWVFRPLLEPLLSGARYSPAALVAVGQHRLTSDGEPSREWAHFLPDDWQDDDAKDRLARLLWGVAYHADPLRLSRAGEHMLLSTALLEDLHARRDRRISLLAPLLISFVPHPDHDAEALDLANSLGGLMVLNPDKRLLFADWSDLRRHAMEQGLITGCDECVPSDWVREAGKHTPVRNGLWAPAPTPEADDAVRYAWMTYQKGLSTRATKLLNALGGKGEASKRLGYDGKQGCVEPVNYLGHWLTSANRLDENTIHRLLRYVLYTHDLCHTPGTTEPLFSHILTIPASVPDRPNVQAFSLTAYIRSGTWLVPNEGDHEENYHQLALFSTMFRAAGVVLVSQPAGSLTADEGAVHAARCATEGSDGCEGHLQGRLRINCSASAGKFASCFSEHQLAEAAAKDFQGLFCSCYENEDSDKLRVAVFCEVLETFGIRCDVERSLVGKRMRLPCRPGIVFILNVVKMCESLAEFGGVLPSVSLRLDTFDSRAWRKQIFWLPGSTVAKLAVLAFKLEESPHSLCLQSAMASPKVDGSVAASAWALLRCDKDWMLKVKGANALPEAAVKRIREIWRPHHVEGGREYYPVRLLHEFDHGVAQWEVKWPTPVTQ